MLGLAFGDDRCDPARAQLAAVRVGVVAAVGEQGVRSATRSAALASHERDRLEQRQQLGDVIAVGGG